MSEEKEPMKKNLFESIMEIDLSKQKITCLTCRHEFMIPIEKGAEPKSCVCPHCKQEIGLDFGPKHIDEESNQ